MTVKFMNVHSYSYKPESLPSASLYNVEQVRLISQDNCELETIQNYTDIYQRGDEHIFNPLKIHWLTLYVVHLVCHNGVDQSPLSGTTSGLKARSLWHLRG